jgi:hypothetical protein
VPLSQFEAIERTAALQSDMYDRRIQVTSICTRACCALIPLLLQIMSEQVAHIAGHLSHSKLAVGTLENSKAAGDTPAHELNLDTTACPSSGSGVPQAAVGQMVVDISEVNATTLRNQTEVEEELKALTEELNKHPNALRVATTDQMCEFHEVTQRRLQAESKDTQTEQSDAHYKELACLSRRIELIQDDMISMQDTLKRIAEDAPFVLKSSAREPQLQEPLMPVISAELEQLPSQPVLAVPANEQPDSKRAAPEISQARVIELSLFSSVEEKYRTEKVRLNKTRLSIHLSRVFAGANGQDRRADQRSARALDGSARKAFVACSRTRTTREKNPAASVRART